MSLIILFESEWWKWGPGGGGKLHFTEREHWNEPQGSTGTQEGEGEAPWTKRRQFVMADLSSGDCISQALKKMGPCHLCGPWCGSFPSASPQLERGGLGSVTDWARLRAGVRIRVWLTWSRRPRPTLGACKLFIAGEKVEILHTGVCAWSLAHKKMLGLPALGRTS